MNASLDITYRGMESSDSTHYVVTEQLEKLERHCPALQSCKVVVTAPSKGLHGGHFKVSVALRVPGNEFVADRDPQLSHSHQDCHSAVRDVFRAALRELDQAHARETDRKRRKD